MTYITHSWGGAAQFAKLAEKKQKRVINIASMMHAETQKQSILQHTFSEVRLEKNAFQSLPRQLMQKSSLKTALLLIHQYFPPFLLLTTERLVAIMVMDDISSTANGMFCRSEGEFTMDRGTAIFIDAVRNQPPSLR